MKIDSLMVGEASHAIYYDPDFRNVLEMHVVFLRVHPTTREVPVEPIMAHRFEFDLFGLLAKLNVPPHLHFLTMRLNKITSPHKIDINLTNLLVPDDAVVNRIRQSHTAVQRIT